jgi:hypothetical protein
MPETFAPFKQEKLLRVEITAREAHLLKVLRKYPFGKIIVHKANGVLIRIEPNESQLINEDDGLDLAC